MIESVVNVKTILYVTAGSEEEEYEAGQLMLLFGPLR
jgi:hypothetical protein